MKSNHELEKSVTYLLEIGGSPSGAASLLIRTAAEHPPELFMHLVPDDVRQAMREQCDKPPATIADLHYFESSNYRAEFFRGLTDEEVTRKIEEDRNARKQRLLDGMVAVDSYFKKH